MKYLTKSRFKIGMSCPTKLYFESNSSQFDNDDDLKAAIEEDLAKVRKYFI